MCAPAGFFSLKGLLPHLIVCLVALVLTALWSIYWSVWRLPLQQKEQLLSLQSAGTGFRGHSAGVSPYFLPELASGSSDAAAILPSDPGAELMGPRRRLEAAKSVSVVQNSFRFGVSLWGKSTNHALSFTSLVDAFLSCPSFF